MANWGKMRSCGKSKAVEAAEASSGRKRGREGRQASVQRPSDSSLVEAGCGFASGAAAPAFSAPEAIEDDATDEATVETTDEATERDSVATREVQLVLINSW